MAVVVVVGGGSECGGVVVVVAEWGGSCSGGGGVGLRGGGSSGSGCGGRGVCCTLGRDKRQRALHKIRPLDYGETGLQARSVCHVDGGRLSAVRSVDKMRVTALGRHLEASVWVPPDK
jgi:hypothetical protein